MNTISSRGRAHDHDAVPLPLRYCTRDLAMVDYADRHRIHQRILIVTLVEIDFTSDSRDAETIPIVADAFDDTLEQVPRPRMIHTSEAERIEGGDRPCSHRKDISH